MARPRQPIELIEAKGKKHLGKAEIEARKKAELKVHLTNVKAPSYLPENLIDEFDEVAGKLLDIGIMTELDEDCLARYLLAKQQYLNYTALLNTAIKAKKIYDMDKLSNLQDKAFKQCRACATDLGLTIASRCKLVMPDTKEAEPDNKFSRFMSGGTGK